MFKESNSEYFLDYACDYPVVPAAGLNLEVRNYDFSVSPLIPVNSDLEYGCADGMKFEKSFDLETENATCRNNNTWDEPIGAWSECITSKWLSERKNKKYSPCGCKPLG